MIDKRGQGVQSEREDEVGSDHPDAADKVAILDYVMIDFVDNLEAPPIGE